MRNRFPTFLVTALLYGIAMNAQAVTFIDNTFNLADYSSPVIYNPQGLGITIQQCTTCGNPGAALQELVSFPAGSNDFNSIVGLANMSFTYNPSVQGGIASLDFSVDRFVDVNAPFNLTGSAARPLILQNGNYYLVTISYPGVLGTWATVAQELHASDFQLCDFTTNTFNPLVHPDFSSAGSTMQFGIANRARATGGPFTIDNRLDNLSITVNSVPEPSTLLLFGTSMIGLLGYTWLQRKKRDQESLR